MAAGLRRNSAESPPSESLKVTFKISSGLASEVLHFLFRSYIKALRPPLTTGRGTRPCLWSCCRRAGEWDIAAWPHLETPFGTEAQRLFTEQVVSRCFYLQVTEQSTSSGLKTEGDYLKQKGKLPQLLSSITGELLSFCLAPSALIINPSPLVAVTILPIRK